MKSMPFLILFCFILTLTTFAQSDSPTLFQKPAINRTHIVFVYAGDLWIVPREGGEAKRLTSGVGTETDPCFSPDGSTIAFTGQYDGNVDVFTVPASGGIPKRLTFHPGADNTVGWTNDGKRVLFSSGRNSTNPVPRLFTIAADGSGLPDELPLPMASYGSYSPDSTLLAYQPLVQWQPEWKKYRGGQTSPIWIARLSDSTIEKLPRENSNDKNTMWIGDKIYFLSDRSGTVALFVFDTKSKKVSQVIPNTGLDIKSASAYSVADKSAIVYEQFGAIHLLDLKTNRSSKVNINVAGDLAAVRPRFEKAGNRLVKAAISPTGARAVFEARGEIITVPAEKGDPRNLTTSPGVMDRDPAWSPDGKWIAYFSDESGEYALHLRDQRGEGETKKINLGNPASFFYSPVWSPDSKKIAFTDKRLNLWSLEIEKGVPVKVDTNTYENPWRVMDPNWSPDSKWITYTRQLKNRLCAVFVYSLDTGKSTQITDGLSDARYANFDRNGKYIYFTASTDAGPTTGWLDMSSFPYQTTRSAYLVVLKKGESSPLAPESDEEKVVEEKKDTANAGHNNAAQEGEKKPDAAPTAAAKPGDKKAPAPIVIDFEGINHRILSLPIPARNFAGMIAGKSGTLFLLEVTGGGLQGAGAATIHKFDLEKRKFDKVMEGVSFFDLSANGEKALYRQGQNWVIANVATLGQPLPPTAPNAPHNLKVSEIELQIDPRAEWKQMYAEAWRIQRDFLYDPTWHGLDLETTKKRYEPWLQAVGHRADLNYLFDEMLNNISVGHHFIRGGDIPNPNFVPGGLLGADYKIENNRYRFAKIYSGENWNPNLRSPLTQPGVDIKEGEYLLAVRGRNLAGSDNIYQFFEATANKQAVIRVGPNPDGTGSREVTVVPLANENALRNREWMEANRRKVEQMSGGKLAYIYLPDTAGGGYTNFNRYYFSQTDKQGAVLDERYNGGGTAANYIIDYLRRPLMNKWVTREGEDFTTPATAIFGPKAMIVNEFAGSGGDMMPWLFRKAGLGPLVGKRTWGGLVGIYDYPPLMDGGMVTAPRVAFYNLQGQWDVENYGTPPDIEIEMDPALWRQGKDPQLEKAVEYLLEELRKNPAPQYKRPAFPNFQKPVTPTAVGGSSSN